jgi:hypothetical protein
MSVKGLALPFKRMDETPASAPSFEDMLAQTATTEPKAKGKSKVPTIPAEIVPDDLKRKVDDFLQAKEISKSAEATMMVLGQEIEGFCKAYQDERAYEGAYSKSFKLTGEEKTLTFASSNRWSINPQDYKRLSDYLGDAAKRLLKVSYSVRLRDEVFQKPELKEALMQMVGARFGEFFISEPDVKVSETFDSELYSVLEKDQLQEFRAFARQYKASLR